MTRELHVHSLTAPTSSWSSLLHSGMAFASASRSFVYFGFASLLWLVYFKLVNNVNMRSGFTKRHVITCSDIDNRDMRCATMYRQDGLAAPD